MHTRFCLKVLTTFLIYTMIASPFSMTADYLSNQRGHLEKINTFVFQCTEPLSVTSTSEANNSLKQLFESPLYNINL